MVRVAIITEEDKIWSLYVWERTIPLLKKSGVELIGLWNCPPKLSRLNPNEVKLWYLKTFGNFTFLKLGIFAAIAMVNRLGGSFLASRPRSFRNLCNQEKVRYFSCSSPNDEVFINWIKENDVDVVIIMVGDILKDKIISAPRIGLINKHAGLLPTNKGIFPYFWAFIKDELQGISFHEVAREIDGGKILLQEIVPIQYTSSMIKFYLYVFRKYPDMLLFALDNIVKRKFIEPIIDLKSSYHGLPSKSDYAMFTRKGGEIITIADTFRAFRL